MKKIIEGLTTDLYFLFYLLTANIFLVAYVFTEDFTMFMAAILWGVLAAIVAMND